MKATSSQIIIYILSALLGCFFIFSAYTKTQPIQYFEYTIISQLGFSAGFASFLSRFFIGLEAALGLLMLINVFGKGKWVLQFAFILIVAFTIHLTLLYFNLGNDVNCGCMGSLVPMSPGASILKNIGILILLLIIGKYSISDNSNSQHWMASILMAIIVMLPFIIFPTKNSSLALSKLYEAHQKPQDNIELRKGKHFIGFLSLTCTHCRDAGVILEKMKKSNPKLPIYFVFLSPQNDSIQQSILNDFMRETKATNIPYSFLDQKTFIELAGSSVPSMYWVKDTQIVRKVEIPDLNQKELEEWLKK